MRSLRLRLIVTFAGIAGGLVLAAAGGMGLLVERAVWGPLDAALLEEATTLEAIEDLHDPEAFARTIMRIGEESDLGREKFVRISDAGGGMRVEAGRRLAVVEAQAWPDTRSTQAVTLHQDDHVYRVVRYPHAGGGWMELGVNADGQVRTLHRTYATIGLAAIALLATFVALAWTTTTRAVAELERLAAELETLEAASLDRRLSTRRFSEVDRLAGVLNRLLARLEAAMTYLRRFAADAAHELRTPIAALRARLEVALAREPSPEKDREGLLDALEQTERLARLAEDLLTLGAVESGAVIRSGATESIRLDALAREVAEALEPIAQEQGRRFHLRAETAVLVRGVRPLLRRLLLNLVDNAFRHTPSTAEVEVVIASRNGVAQVEVRDEGPGIPPDDLPFVFERFRRSASVSGGSGLGLALCREIVERHGGSISIDRRPRGGTMVTVSLPTTPPV